MGQVSVVPAVLEVIRDLSETQRKKRRQGEKESGSKHRALKERKDWVS